MHVDENATEKFNQVQLKKLTVPTNEATTKRAALGDLQNRGLTRNITSKDVAQKELKDVKLTAKARVDTYWRKEPLGATNANAGKTTTTNVGPLLRSNSVRNGLLTRQAPSRPLVSATSGVVKSSAAVASKPAVAGTVKVKEDQQQPIQALRREDSNLSRRSLTKLRAALAKPSQGVALQKSELLQQKAAPAKAVVVAKKEVAKPRPVVLPVTSKTVVKKDELLKARPFTAPLSGKAFSSASSSNTLSLSSKRLSEIEDIDANDRENLMLVSVYVNDIYDYLYEVEQAIPIQKDHLAGQPEVTRKMRAVLIDWINEVHLQFHLAAETFHLAVAIIDRYLQAVKDTKRSYLQLVGVTALFIATKYEELFPPVISDFVFITDDTYTARQICLMELKILKAIDMNLSRPLPLHFLRRYSKAARAEDEHHAMSKYFLELSSMDYELASYRPSEIAAASLFLSLHLLNDNAKAATGFRDTHWTPTLEHYSRYTAAQLRPITRQIAQLAQDAPASKMRAVYNKYQASKFQAIALRTELYGQLMNSIVNSKN
ncbi:CycB [Drosophila busckii]|uniref:CycB n=2 Tax=Drosophila busckii TaxID=30019 RepID=A0A0M4EFU4_DROBS|nr:CycB [Drosophila busckii]